MSQFKKNEDAPSVLTENLIKLLLKFENSLDEEKIDDTHPLSLEAQRLRASLMKLPGAFLLTESGSIIWRSLLRSSGKDPHVAHKTARQLAEALSQQKSPSDIKFIDEGLMVIYLGQTFPLTKNELGYAIYRLLHETKRTFKWKEIVQEINHNADDFFSFALLDRLENLELSNNEATRKKIQRAWEKVPYELRSRAINGQHGRWLS